MEPRFKKRPYFKMLSLFLALILCLGLWMPVTAQEAAEPEVQAETTLDYDSDGYYTIRSTVSGTPYYLSVQNGSTADGTPVVLKSGTITDRMLWRLETAASGNIKIIPKVGVNLNRAMAVQYSAAAQKQNGLPIQERIYSNDSYYSDEWIFSTRYFTYVNYYDTSFANANLQYRIEEANQFASDIFAEFNTPFMYGGTFVYSGMLENCPDGIFHACSDNCNPKHKNTSLISNELYLRPRNENHIYVLWTKRDPATYCYGEYNTPHNSNLLGIVYESRPVAHMIDIDTSADDGFCCMAIVSAHETVHTFGIGHGTHENESASSYYCIMQGFDPEKAMFFYNNITAGTVSALCSSCKTSAETIIPNKIHHGNS